MDTFGAELGRLGNEVYQLRGAFLARSLAALRTVGLVCSPNPHPEEGEMLELTASRLRSALSEAEWENRPQRLPGRGKAQTWRAISHLLPEFINRLPEAETVSP